jgi:uncharacterized membrane protein YccC
VTVHSARDLAFRRGARAAIALPGMLAVVLWVSDNDTAALFAAFAAFALLAMADFGGPPIARTRAYLGATMIGAVLITIGTLVSNEPILAGLLMFVIAFVIMQVAAFGGAWSVGMFATTLAYVLSATFPGPASQIPDRLAGWGVGGLVATVMALVLWPVYERPALWQLAADAVRAVADLVRRAGADGSRDAASKATAALRRGYASSPFRPAGPAVRDRAFVALMEGLERMVALEPHIGGPLRETGATLCSATADVLDATAVCMTDGTAPAPDLGALDGARHDNRTAMADWARGSLRDGMAPAEVLVGVEGSWWTRVMSFMAVGVAADAEIGRTGHTLRGELAATLQTPVEETPGVWARFTRVLRVNLAFGSIRFRNALRTALGLGIAITLAGLLSIDHAFWVGLAVLSVLRSNALATGRTAVQAVGGTVLGFLVVLVFFGIFDAGSTAEWIALPIASFLAAYAPSAISFVVGQASFTVTIVLLFDIIVPDGWHTGVVRVEDIVLGAVVGLCVGLLMWPRGAVGMLREVIGGHLRADADYLGASLRLLAGEPADDEAACRTRACDASRLVGDAYDDLLAAPGTLPPDHVTWGALAAAARQAHASADLLVAQHQLGFEIAPFADATALLHRETDELAAAMRSEATALESAGSAPAVPGEPLLARHAAELDAFSDWRGRDPALVEAAVGIVWASEVLHATDLAVRRAAEAITEVAPAES